MESHIFKTADDIFGIFQKDSEHCAIYYGRRFNPKVMEFNWEQWVTHKTNPSQSTPHTTLTDDISSAISFFVWHMSVGSPDIVECSRACNNPGSYYERINRNAPGLYEHIYFSKNQIDEIRAFNNISEQLNNIFNYIEPDTSNENTFSHKVREILTLACGEVEYNLLQILKSNGVIRDRYTTKDYILALPALKLNEYEVELKMFPSLGKFSPFLTWNKSRATQTLPWYHAYNQVKHDRGGNINQATLKNLINSVAAIHVLLESQYGDKLFDKPMNSDFESCFMTCKKPIWACNEIPAPLIQIAKSELEWISPTEFAL